MRLSRCQSGNTNNRHSPPRHPPLLPLPNLPLSLRRQVCVRILPCLTRKLDCLWVDAGTADFLPFFLPCCHSSIYMAFVSVAVFFSSPQHVRQVKHTHTHKQPRYLTSWPESSGKLGWQTSLITNDFISFMHSRRGSLCVFGGAWPPLKVTREARSIKKQLDYQWETRDKGQHRSDCRGWTREESRIARWQLNVRDSCQRRHMVT